MDKQFKPLNNGEVLSVNKSAQFIIGHSTFRVQEFMNALREQMMQHGFGSVSGDKAQWFSEEGIECEVLQFGSDGWQKGTVRLYLEFSPNEPTTSVPSQASVTKIVPPSTPQPFTSAPVEEELIAQTEATATATAAVEVAQEEADFALSNDFEHESLDFAESLTPPTPPEAMAEDFGEELENEGLSFDDSFSSQGDDFGDAFDEDNDLDFGHELETENDFGHDDFGLGDDDFDHNHNTDGEGLDLGDVFGSDDDSLNLNLGEDEGMDDVWGEMENL